MTDDRFRPLDRIDPPDQWGDIVGRTATDDLEVDLDGAGPRSRRRPATALVAAAAVVVLLAGGAIATRAGVSDDDERAATDVTDASEPAAPDLGGPCPFSLDGPGIPAAEPFTPEATEDTFPDVVQTTGRVVVDGLEVVVSLGGRTTADGPISGAVGSRSVDLAGVDPVADTIAVRGVDAVSDEAPCTDASALVVSPLDAADAAVPDDQQRQDGTWPSDRAAYVSAVQPTIERVLDAVVTQPGTEAAAAPCSFTLDDPTIPALTPKAPGEEEPFSLLDDLTSDWRRTEVDGARVFVGVGSQPGGPLAEPGERWTADEADFATGERRAMVRAYEGLTSEGSCTSVAVFVVFPLTDAEVTGIEAGTLAGPDIAAPTALAERALDALVVEPAGG